MPNADRPPDFPRAADVVRRVGRLREWADFDVDHVPPSWDLHLTHTSHGVEKIDHEAQRVLALLLSWHTPRPGGGARFAGDALDVSYDILMRRFRIAKRDHVGRILKRMEEVHGVIRRDSGPRGVNRGAYLRVTLVMDRVEEITYPVTMDPGTGELVGWRGGPPVSGGPYLIPTVRHFEAEPTGLAYAEDERAVHLLSIQKRVGSDGEALPIDEPLPVGDPGQTETEVADVTVGRTGPVGPRDRDDVHDADGAGGDQAGPTGTPRSDPAPATGPVGGRPVARSPAPTNAPARRPTIDDDDRLRRQLDAFRGRFESELARTTGDEARRAVARTAWMAATELLPGQLDGDAVYNAWKRLERAGSADPALDLVGVAVFACGRVTGRVGKRADTAHALLSAVGRRRPTAAVDPSVAPDEATVHRALRTALVHRLDPFSAQRTVVRVCGFRHEPATYRFVNGLVRLYATRDVPFNAALFAGALAAVVRDHPRPTATDLLDACEDEARLYPGLHVTAGDFVLVGARGEHGEVVPDEAVHALGQGGGRRLYDGSADEWAEVEEVDVRGRVVVGADGTSLDLDRATVDRDRLRRVEWLTRHVRTAES